MLCRRRCGRRSARRRRAVGVEEVEGDRGAAPLAVARPVDRGRRRAVRVPERVRARRAASSPSVCDARVDRLDADPLEEAQADLDRGQVEVVDGAVLEVRRAGRGLVPLALDEGGDDRAAGEPGPLELGERVAAREQAADAGRLAEHLVEGERDEVGVPAGEVEPVGRHVGGGVEQHVPAVLRAPGRSSRADAARRRSSTGPGRRTGCGARRRRRSGSGAAASRRRAARGRRSARRWSRRRARGRTRGCR